MERSGEKRDMLKQLKRHERLPDGHTTSNATGKQVAAFVWVFFFPFSLEGRVNAWQAQSILLRICAMYCITSSVLLFRLLS